MSRDPVIKVAAVAALHGLDPLRLLALGRDDFLVAMAVVQETDRLALERANTINRVLSEATGRWTAAMVSRLFRKRG